MKWGLLIHDNKDSLVDCMNVNENKFITASDRER